MYDTSEHYLIESCPADPGFLTAEESRNLLNAMKAYESEKDVSVANMIERCYDRVWLCNDINTSSVIVRDKAAISAKERIAAQNSRRN